MLLEIMPFVAQASNPISTAAEAVKGVETKPITDAITGFLPTMLGLVMTGVGIRKIVSWFRKGIKAI